MRDGVVEGELHELQRKLLEETRNGFVSYASPALYDYRRDYFDRNTERLKTMISNMESMSEYDMLDMDPDSAYGVLGQIELKKRIEVLEGKLNDIEHLKEGHEKIKKEFQEFREGMASTTSERQSEKCFDLNTRVLLENNEFIPMKDVRLGDRICSGMENGKLQFSEVYLITHHEEVAKTEYRKIGYNSGSESGAYVLHSFASSLSPSLFTNWSI